MLRRLAVRHLLLAFSLNQSLPVLFQRRVIVTIEVVKTYNGEQLLPFHNSQHEVAIDKAGRAGDEDGFLISALVFFKGVPKSYLRSSFVLPILYEYGSSVGTTPLGCCWSPSVGGCWTTTRLAFQRFAAWCCASRWRAQYCRLPWTDPRKWRHV